VKEENSFSEPSLLYLEHYVIFFLDMMYFLFLYLHCNCQYFIKSSMKLILVNFLCTLCIFILYLFFIIKIISLN